MEANYEAVKFYTLASTQMQYALDGTPLGLAYNGLDFLFKLHDVENRLEVFEKIKVIEAASLKAAREK